MEQNLDVFTKKADKIFHQLYEKIFSYLDFPSLMQELTVSKDFYHLLNKYFKEFLRNNNLLGQGDIVKDEEDYYLKLFRAFYSREVLACQLSSIKQSYNELQLVRYPRCSTYGVKDFAMGAKFTAFHLYNNDLIFLKNEEYLNPLFNMKNINRKNVRKNVVKFSPKSNDLMYLTNTGHLHIIFYNANLPSDELTEGILAITLQKPLLDFSVMYPHAVLAFKVPEKADPHGHVVDNQEEHKENKAKIYQEIQCLNMQNIIPEDFNSPARLMKVDGLDDQKVLSFCVGIPAAYFLTDKNKLYECDFSAVNNEKFMIFPFEQLKNKTIIRIWSGPNYFFAMEQNENPSIDNWSQQQILEWGAKSKDYNEFINILKYENITGKDLLSADKSFLINRLGMEREDLQVKFLNDIQKVSKKTFTKPRLFGWGNNSYGQLGLNTGHVMVNHVSEVKALPELEKGDQIEDIECGFKATVIRTYHGRVWITEVLPKKAPPKEEEEPQSKPNQTRKKGRESAELPKEKEAEKPFTRWLDITPRCQQLKDGRQYKIVKISISKDYFAALGANLGKKVKVQKAEEEQEPAQPKFKGADHICSRLLWDKSLNRDEFVVGYEDRFLGILEIPFNEFSLKKDIPSHRIKFFKRNGEIVWDRVQKVNII